MSINLTHIKIHRSELIKQTSMDCIPRYAVVSPPITDDMCRMVDDIRRVDPVITIPRATIKAIEKAWSDDMDRMFMKAIRG